MSPNHRHAATRRRPRGTPRPATTRGVRRGGDAGQDYRDVTGQYDRVLAPGGAVSLQAITMAHHRYQTTRNSYGCIQKYIVPGGLIPSPEAIDHSLAQHTDGLRVTARRSLGQDYALTLQTWRRRFDAHWPTIAAQGFDETFRRMWTFYLAYCEAGFAVDYLDVLQLQIQRPS